MTMSLPFFARGQRPKLPLPQLAKTLSDPVRDTIAEDSQKVELLFRAWLDTQTPITDVDDAARHVHPSHDQKACHRHGCLPS